MEVLGCINILGFVSLNLLKLNLSTGVFQEYLEIIPKMIFSELVQMTASKYSMRSQGNWL